MASVTIQARTDTWLNENSPDTAYGANTSLRLGDAIDGASKDSHLLLDFPIQSYNPAGAGYIPAGALITGVSLNMKLWDKEWAGVTSASSSVKQMLVNWYAPQSTWNLRFESTDWLTPGANNAAEVSSTAIYTWTRRSTDTNGWEYHNLGSAGIALVQAWLDGTAPAYGLKITGAAPGTGTQKNAHMYRSVEYGSDMPQLVVTYTPDGAPTLNNDLTAANVTATGFQLSASLDSDGGDALTTYGFYIAPGGSNPVYHQVGTGTPTLDAQWTHDFTGLTEGSSYMCWAYAANDAGNDNGYASNGQALWVTTLDIASKSGDGGAGITESITGTNTDYAGGGGGGHSLTAQRGVGSHGGGNAGSAGAANTGGGGGANAAGGSGIAVLKYAIADAISATPALANDIFRPSLAYHSGKLFAPYADASGMQTVSISSITQGTDTTINTSGAHGLEAGQVISISGTSCTPNINGVQLVKAITDSDTFTLEMQTTAVAVGTGTIQYNHLTGYAKTADGYEDGYIRTSRSSFHTGSLMKDFRYISIIHEPIPEASVLAAAYTIDDVRYPTEGFSAVTSVSAKESRLPMKRQGFEVDIELSLQGTAESIIVKGFNVVWNFLKIPKHLYSLDLRDGAGSGRWKENAEEALQFLFTVADAEAEFEDRFNGTYNGTVEQIEYQQANFSLEEGPQGLVKLLVREVK